MRNVPPGQAVDNVDSALIARELQIRAHREVVDANECWFDVADVVEVLDLPVGCVFEVFGGVDITEDSSAIVCWSRRRVSRHPAHLASPLHDVLCG